MPLINHDKFFYIPNNVYQCIQSKEISTLSNVLYHKFLDDPMKYFYVEIHSEASIYVIPSILSDAEKQMLRDKELHLIISNTHESFHSIILPIYQIIVLGMGVDESQVTVISESADIKTHIDHIANKLNLKPINAYWSLVFQNQISEQLRLQKISGKLFKTLENKIYEKKFLNFNRRWRLHRPAFVALLKATNLLEKGFVSLGRCDFYRTFQSVWNDLLELHKLDQSEEVYNLLINNQEQIFQLPEMYLDVTNLIDNQGDLSHTTDQYYLDTYFSLVSETNYYTGPGYEMGRFFSEKIFKPIAERHPFILITVPNSLPLLRELGYQTFSPWINEDYDNEKNDSIRMLKILREVERLSNLDQVQLEEFLNNIGSICDHNQQTLLEKQDHRYILRQL